MGIKSCHIKGLNGLSDHELVLHSDLNIITGRNGAGKTTLLKLIWYMISGNVELIPTEIKVQEARVALDNGFVVYLRVEPSTKAGRGNRWLFGLETPDGKSTTAYADAPYFTVPRILRFNERVAAATGRSLFFPTFRRIEGGFSMSSRSPGTAPTYGSVHYRPAAELNSAVADLARRLTVDDHRFVSSISTGDIVAAVTERYAALSEKINEDHRKLSTEIISMIRAFESENEESTANTAPQILSSIKNLVASHTGAQEHLFKPFVALTSLVGRILRHRGIQLSSALTLGSATEAINSDALSAGEKQMLSFLAYNAFEEKAIIFVDEPEISLHVDWQRTLVPTLLAQSGTNQFICSTHSPFIYSKYTDKEITLHPDRGDSEPTAQRTIDKDPRDS